MSCHARLVTSLVLCLAGAGPAVAGHIDLHDLLRRRYEGDARFQDQFFGVGYISRLDRFTNIGSEYTVRIDGVEAILLNPEEVGFADIFGDAAGPGLGNANEVVAAAQTLNPDWHFFGSSWWIDQDRPPVDWSPGVIDFNNGINPPALAPFTVGPGESFTLNELAIGYYPFPFPPPTGIELIGELVIGWRFTGDIVPLGPPPPPTAAPEPMSLTLAGVGAVGVAAARRRKRKADRPAVAA